MTNTTTTEAQAYADFVRDFTEEFPNEFIFVSPTNDMFLD